MKQNGKGWGEVFKEMKSQGLVQDRNLGQAVSRQAVSQMSRGGGATAARTDHGRDGGDAGAARGGRGTMEEGAVSR